MDTTDRSEEVSPAARPPRPFSRRRFLQGTASAAAVTGLAGLPGPLAGAAHAADATGLPILSL
ncbi:twin-arginine translocation signal domain-containing protein, partial [Streptomyces rimosus]|uniref:twin-arginine translocation signal domain-containing protein n=1 Tax=Streptomyces rimosus TaxID=1927 RepID=UPI0005B32543